MSDVFQNKSEIRQILGMVLVDRGSVMDEPAENATRWIMDVYQDDPEIQITLKNKYPTTRKALHSYSIAPLDLSFWGATVHLEEKDGSVVMKCSHPCRYRLAVDTVHSASR
jgi:hypothetical protein